MSRNTSINAKFLTDLERIFDGTRGQLQAIAKEALLEAGKRLVDYSPVGDPSTWQNPKRALYPKDHPYQPGTFKNNWQVGIDVKPTEEEISGPDIDGHDSLDRLSHLGRWQLDHKYYFVNNLPYAKLLEFGWSPQIQPHGMVGRIKMEWKQIVKDAVHSYNKQEGFS